MWPPPFDEAAARAPHTPPPAAPLPPQDQLDYFNKGVTALLLLLALPWLVWKLVTNPAYVITGAGRHHLRT